MAQVYSVSVYQDGQTSHSASFNRRSDAKARFHRFAILHLKDPGACVLLTRDRADGTGTVMAHKSAKSTEVVLNDLYYSRAA